MFQKMSINFALDFISLNRPDSTPVVSYDSLYSSVYNIMTNSEQQRDDNPKEAHFNLQMVQQLLSSYKPDLKIVSEDQESIQTYKLLLGMSSKLFGGIFLQEDFVTESVTTVLVPLHSTEVKLMLNYFENGSKLPDDLADLFSVSSPSFTKDRHSDENAFANDHFMPAEAKAEDSIKIEEEGELPVLIKFQNTAKTTNANCRQRRIGNIWTCPKEKCIQCGKKYRYMDKHTQEICDKVKAGIRNYAKNYKEAKASKVPCELCGKILTNWGMNKHMEIHNPVGRTYYNCDQCAYRTVSKQALTQHMKNHEGVVLETCHICGGKYKDLKKHINRSHNNKNNNLMVKCESCGKEIRKMHLAVHMKQVHMERKYACHLCSYKAQSNSNLKLHISKSHLGVKELKKEQCPHCDVRTRSLQHHLKIYHPC